MADGVSAGKGKGGPDGRPLSPHLQIWRWHPTMLTSILHRATGVALYVGALFFALWLVSIALGPQVYVIGLGAVIGQAVILGAVFLLALVALMRLGAVVAGVIALVLTIIVGAAAMKYAPQPYWQTVSSIAQVLSPIVLWGIVFSACFHILSGFRHLVWDMGGGFNPKLASLFSNLIIIGAVLLTAGIWYWSASTPPPAPRFQGMQIQ